jgi:hypothetical protein
MTTQVKSLCVGNGSHFKDIIGNPVTYVYRGHIVLG